MRIAIVNDVPVSREILRRLVEENGRHSVAWFAEDGSQAVVKCLADRPDLILLDMLMPNMDGVECTRQIMMKCPCAILIVTASVSGNCAQVFEAMGHGALDVVATPILTNPEGRKALIGKIASIEKLIGVRPEAETRARPARPGALASLRKPRLIAIGASAGGPLALAPILTALPPDGIGTIVIVQHVDASFAEDLAAWLQTQSQWPVRIAREGMGLDAGTVLIAGREDHLRLGRQCEITYTAEPRESNFRPSVDVFMKSVALQWRHEALGVILTGMGKDGAEGLKALRDKGHPTIAQDRATSAVYGMPKAAAAIGAAGRILPLSEIAAAVRAYCSSTSTEVATAS